MANKYPRESVEFVPVAVTVNSMPVTLPVSFSLTTGAERPTEWTDSVQIGNDIGFLLEGKAPGVWHVWARVVDNPEIPVVHCGVIEVD